MQDIIPDHVDRARENSSDLKFTFCMTIFFAEIVLLYVTCPRYLAIFKQKKPKNACHAMHSRH